MNNAFNTSGALTWKNSAVTNTQGCTGDITYPRNAKTYVIATSFAVIMPNCDKHIEIPNRAGSCILPITNPSKKGIMINPTLALIREISGILFKLSIVMLK